MLSDNGPQSEYGPNVVFRHEDTGDILWAGAMYRPHVGDIVGEVIGGETKQWYKVEEVRFEFWCPAGDEGTPLTPCTDERTFGIVAYVSVLP